MGKVVCPWDTLINFVTDAFVGYGIPRGCRNMHRHSS